MTPQQLGGARSGAISASRAQRRLETVLELIDLGADLDRICEAAGQTPGGLYRFLLRRGRADLIRQLGLRANYYRHRDRVPDARWAGPDMSTSALRSGRVIRRGRPSYGGDL